MRAILHAKFADHPARLSRRPDSVSLTQPNPQLRDSSVDEFEAALIKARDAWRGRGPRSSRTATYSDRIARHR
jgi:hypothetical protein